MIERFKAAFLRFRGGNAFVATLACLLGAWWAAHLLFGFDQDKSTANFWLSVEASLTTSWLLDLTLKMSAQDRATLREIAAKEDAILGEVAELADHEKETPLC